MKLLLFVRIVYESISQAFQQLWSHKLRSFLSLLGITIGIWCIIIVYAAVDSLETSIRNSMQELGDDVVYISRMPWGEDPRENFWKYMRRPESSYKDFQAIKSKVATASISSYNVFIGGSTAEYTESSVSNVFFVGVTEDYRDMFNLKFEKGRYFSLHEFYNGSNQIVIGYEVAQTLFSPSENPVGKTIRVKGQKLQIIGVLEKEGKDLLNPINYDNVGLIPYNTARKFVNLINTHRNKGRSSITVKAAPGVSIDELKAEVTGVLRARRRLSPKEESNFALNTLSILSNLLGDFFGVINLAGGIIGFFAIIVGVFSVANIMFVSVRERQSIIGVKKALGAKQYMILLEFLIESIVLCSIGGGLGLLLVYLAAYGATALFGFSIFLSMENILWGLGIAISSGVIAGILPAWSASKMIPVEAIRS